MLTWDGLLVHIPAMMEPVTLDRGFIRLSGADGQIIDFRFGPEKEPFDVKRDGRRILQAAGLAAETLEPCRTTWASGLPGTLYNSSRLYLLHFRESRGIVAALFSTPPPQTIVENIFTALQWSPLDTWRCWRCYDLTFETPPNFALARPEFRPGRFHLTFTKGRSKLIFDRLAPANVLLADMSLERWCRHHLSHGFYDKVTILRCSDTEIDFHRRPPLISRILPWLPGCSQPLKGKIRHLPASNKILILAEQGPAMTDTTSYRINTSYATTPSHKT